MSSDLEQEIQRRVHALPHEKQQQLLTIIDVIQRDSETPSQSELRPIGDLFEELSLKIPLEEWSKLPTDGADQHDHYLYGAPKRRNPTKP